MVVDGTGVCIDGAIVQVVHPAGSLGESIAQTKPCDAWGYDGGFVIRNLTAGVGVTLRASAPGYAPVERTFIPSSGPAFQYVFLRLSPSG